MCGRNKEDHKTYKSGHETGISVSEPEPSVTRSKSATRSVAPFVETDHRHAIFFTQKNRRDIFEARALFYPAELQAQSDECGRRIRLGITGGVAATCGRTRSSVLQYPFVAGSLYYKNTADHMHTSFRTAPNVLKSPRLCTVNLFNTSISLR